MIVIAGDKVRNRRQNYRQNGQDDQQRAESITHYLILSAGGGRGKEHGTVNDHQRVEAVTARANKSPRFAGKPAIKLCGNN